MRRRAIVVLVGVVGCVLMSAGLASADRCHSRLSGTRSFTLRAEVTAYRFARGRVTVDWARSADCAGTAVWDYRAQTRANGRLACQRGAKPNAASSAMQLVASDATHTVRVVVGAASADVPDRLVVLDRANNRQIASWPLSERFARVALYRGIAILSSSTRDALYALRISDGRTGQIGISSAGDRPLIGPAGVLYQSALDVPKDRTASVRATLNLLPLATVREEVARPYSTVRRYMSYSTPTANTEANRRLVARVKRASYRGADPPRPFRSNPITAISMDGSRVAIAVRDPSGVCDYVFFWNVHWHYLTRLTRASGQTCLPVHAPGGITDVAIAGSRAIWTVTYGRKTRVLAAAITDCQEWVVARPVSSARVALAGEDEILAYAVERPGVQRVSSEIGVVPRLWRGSPIEQIGSSVRALSVYGGRIAALSTSGTVNIMTGNGESTAAFEVPGARAIALGRKLLAAVNGSGALAVYGVENGRLIHSWKVASNATSVDMQYGIALITAGHDVYAVNTATGRTVHLFHAPGRVAAQIEAPGAAIQYNAKGHGYLAFVPLSRIEASTR